MCPGQNESAGKRKSSRLRKGAPWLKTLLVAMRLGGHAKEGQLLQGAIQSAASQARTEESHLRRRRLDADRDLPHAEGRDAPSGSRCRSFRPPLKRGESQASRRSTRQARLPRRTTTRCSGGLNAVPNAQPSSEELLPSRRYAASPPNSTVICDRTKLTRRAKPPIGIVVRG